MWPRLLLALRDGYPLPHRPHAVVWPETPREVAAIVKSARKLGVAVVPYGGGSGVCGGAVPIRGGISLDLKRMDSVLSVSHAEMLVDVEAGANGERFERDLEQRGYTLGHFPSSIYCSTVGGWLACRAAGQMSTKYGKIEDRVAGVTVVTGRGDIVETDGFERASRGPNWTQLFVGSEGTLGVITSARLRVSPEPALRVLRGFEFASVTEGVEAIRRVMQRGLRPAVVRLYDEFDSLLHALSTRDDADRPDPRLGPALRPGEGALPALPPRATGTDDGGALSRLLGAASSGSAGSFARGLRREALAAALSRPRLLNAVTGPLVERALRKGCRMIVGLEGARIRTEVEAGATFGELERAGGRDLGEEPGRDWFQHRYSVSYGMSKVFRDGAFVDTMEVAATWERVLDMYTSVKEAIAQHALVMAHFSHAYPSGCSIYFTFVAYSGTRPGSEAIYDAIWRDGLAAATRAGGTISHHHGVGLLKSAHMTAEHREAMTLLRALKTTLDPDGIMNPGKLGLPLYPGARA
jgi:alkyldihydroxyacetonephosphate synthase